MSFFVNLCGKLVIPLICLSKKRMLNISEKYDELQLKRQKLKDEIILRID